MSGCCAMWMSLPPRRAVCSTYPIFTWLDTQDTGRTARERTERKLDSKTELLINFHSKGRWHAPLFLSSHNARSCVLL